MECSHGRNKSQSLAATLYFAARTPHFFDGLADLHRVLHVLLSNA
jgi:hypothetical protein